jgi:PAS domain S-box-containing protein
MDGKTKFYSSEHRLRTKKRDYKWVLERGRQVEADEDGNIIRAAGTMLDITEARQAADALRKSEEKFRRFFENEPNYCYMVAPDGTIMDANRAALERMGYSRDELLGKQIRSLYADESQEKVKELLEKWKVTGILRDEEIVIKTRSGARRIVLLSSSALRDKEGKIIHSLSIQRDITEIRNAQNELERSYRDLELYASLLQHDLRSDLQIILSHAEATKVTAEADSNQEASRTAVEASSLRMVRLLDAFQRPTREQERDIVQLLEKLAEMAEVAHSGLKIEIKLENRPRGKIVNVGRLLPMVFDNLFRNAFIYGGENTNVLMSIKFTRTGVIIDVADDGPGIDDTIRDHLFKKGASTSGGGYGLHLSQKVIEGYGGTMNLLSSSSKGTTFRIVLPVT